MFGDLSDSKLIDILGGKAASYEDFMFIVSV